MNLRISKTKADNICIAIFLFFVLFLPNTPDLVRYYFLVLLITIPLLLGHIKKIHFDYLTKIALGVFAGFVILTSLRFFSIEDPNLRDYTEVARLLLPLLMLVFRDKFKNLRLKTIFTVFAIYASVDCLISILDFINYDVMGIVSLTKSLYVSNTHAVVLKRICGLSAGPAQHATIMLIIFIFFYCRIFQSKKITAPAFFSIISTFPIFLTQSRTIIVTWIVVSLGIAFFYLIFGKKFMQYRSISLLFLLLGGGTFLVIQYHEFFRRTLALMGGIQSISSWQDRVQGHEILFHRALKYPAFLLIGYGKNFFHTSVFDNEYIMMFLVYGPFIAFIFVGGTVIFIINFLLSKGKNKYVYNTMLCFLLLAGLVIAFPNSFFLQASVIPVLFVFINIAYWENRELKLSKER
jgi:hypothetical protein